MPIEVNEQGELIKKNITTPRNLRSDAMRELLSQKPSFIQRWAILLFVFILVLLGSATWFIHYPDIVQSTATILATNGPKEIVVRQEGRLVKLFVANDDSVTTGQPIGYIESTALHGQVLKLSTMIDSASADLQQSETQKLLQRFEIGYDSLGELQQGYQQFIAAQQQFTDYLQNGFYLRKKYVLSEDAVALIKTRDILLQQKELLSKDLALSEETYKANASLLKEKVISKQDDRNEQSKLLAKQMSIPQVNSALLANETSQREKNKEIAELEHTISLQKTVFQQALQTFQAAINEWKRKYIISAPITGRIAFPSPIQENQFVRAGQLIGMANPPGSLFYAEVLLPQNNFGKVASGQQVQLRFAAYPFQEFGYVPGTLVYVSEIATDSGFVGRIQLNHGLFTSQNKTIHYRDGLKAEAQIVVKDMRLLERFYYNTLTSFKR